MGRDSQVFLIEYFRWDLISRIQYLDIDKLPSWSWSWRGGNAHDLLTYAMAWDNYGEKRRDPREISVVRVQWSRRVGGGRTRPRRRARRRGAARGGAWATWANGGHAAGRAARRGATWPAAARGCGCFEDLIGWGRGGRGRIAAVGVNRVDGWMDGWTCSDPWCWPFWGWGWGWSTTDLSVSVTVFFGHLIRRCLDHSKSPHFLLFLYSSLFFWGEGSVGFFFL